MAEESGPIPSEARQLMAAAIRAALGRIDDHKKAGGVIRHYEDYPYIQTFEDSGLPIFWKDYPGPLDYKSAFEEPLSLARALGLDAKPYKPPEEMPEWHEFLKLAERDPTLQRYFGFADVDPARSSGPRSYDFACSLVFSLLKSAADRIIHISGSTSFSEAIFEILFDQWAHAVTDTDLPIAVVVPLSDVTFECALDVDAGISIEPLTVEIQKCRYGTDLSQVAQRATHAIFLRGWTYLSHGLRRVLSFRPDELTDPLDTADLLCAALRTVQEAPIGYAQVVILQQGWADSWKADLLSGDALEIRAYPAQLQTRFYFDRPFSIGDATAQEAKTLFHALKENRLAFAARRLNRAYLRDRDDDAVVDLAVGVEALLNPENAPEISYRLRLRGAALARLTSTLDPTEAADRIKTLYDIRSRVVHGENVGSAKLTAAKEDGKAILRMVLQGLGRRPDLLEAKRLDAALLTGQQSTS
jgi:hypothetical protein